MAHIRIVEKANGDGFAVRVAMGDEGEFEAAVKPPFDAVEEQKLEWYFEEYLRYPFAFEARAKEAAASVKAYGESLFKQLFADPSARAIYEVVKREGLEHLRFEITGSPAFHALHWEALKDPDLPSAFSLGAPMVRKSPKPQPLPAEVNPSPTLNVLIVTARPNAERDVGYRTITRPLLETLKQAELKVHVDIVRPGTYRAFKDHLEEAKPGRYHVVHFDMHGSLMTWEQFQLIQKEGGSGDKLVFKSRFGRGEIEKYDGVKGYLFFEDEGEPTDGSKADPAEASELAALLLKYRIPIVILNACQSGKQSGAQRDEPRGEAPGGRRADRARHGLFRDGERGHADDARALPPPVRRQGPRRGYPGRAPPASRRQGAPRLLPVHHRSRRLDPAGGLPAPPERSEAEAVHATRNGRIGSRPMSRSTRGRTPLTAFSAAMSMCCGSRSGFSRRAISCLCTAWAARAKARFSIISAAGGRRRALSSACSISAMTRRPGRASRSSMPSREKLYDPGRFHGSFLALPEELQQADLAQTLKARRHLLILDNLESITGAALAIKNTLPEAEQAKLKSLLAALKGGRTLALLGSRGQEAWLGKEPSARTSWSLAGSTRRPPPISPTRSCAGTGPRNGARIRTSRSLLKLLDGYPLALEVILPNLARQTPAEILEALRAGEDKVDLKSDDKTKSILRCIDYSHSNLSEEAQELLLCLAPFSGVFNAGCHG